MYELEGNQNILGMCLKIEDEQKNKNPQMILDKKKKMEKNKFELERLRLVMIFFFYKIILNPGRTGLKGREKNYGHTRNCRYEEEDERYTEDKEDGDIQLGIKQYSRGSLKANLQAVRR